MKEFQQERKKKSIKGLLFKLGAGFFSIFLFFIFALVALGFYFERDLKQYLVNAIARETSTDIRISDFSISFIRDWPRVEATLHEIDLRLISGPDTAPFLKAKEVRLGFNLRSFFTGNYHVSRLALEQPDLRLSADSNGRWNFEHFQTAADSTSREITFRLSVLELDGGILKIDHRNFSAEFQNLELALTGDFSNSLSGVSCFANLDAVHCTSGGISWIKQKHLVLETRFSIDHHDDFYQFEDSYLRIAGLHLNLEGSYRDSDKRFVDLRFSTLRNDFRYLLSLVPGEFSSEIAEEDASGEFDLRGELKGGWHAGAVPSLKVDFLARKGRYRHQPSGMEISGLQFDGGYRYLPDNPPKSGLFIRHLRGLVGADSLQGSFSYANFEDPFIQLALKTDMDLSRIRELSKSDSAGFLFAGRIHADVAAEGKLKDFREHNYRNANSRGEIILSDVIFQAPQLDQPVKNLNGKIRFDNSRMDVENLRFTLSGSDLLVSGYARNYIPYLFEKGSALECWLTLNSEFLDLNSLLVSSEREAGDTLSRIEIQPYLTVNMQVAVDSFIVNELHGSNANGKILIRNQTAEVTGMRFDACMGKVLTSGKLDVRRPDKPLIDFTLALSSIDIHQALKTFRQFSSVALVEDKLYGKLDADMRIAGTLDKDLQIIPATFVSTGKVHITKGALQNFEPLKKLSLFMKMDKLMNVKFEDLTTSYEIHDEKFFVPGMDFVANDIRMQVSGWHGFDSRLNYKLKLELPRLLARHTKDRGLSEYIEVAGGEQPLHSNLFMTITGTADDPVFTPDYQAYRNRIREKLAEEKEEFKVARQEEVKELFGEQDTTEVEDWIIEEKKEKSGGGENNFLGKLKKKLPLKLKN